MNSNWDFRAYAIIKYEWIILLFFGALSGAAGDRIIPAERQAVWQGYSGYHGSGAFPIRSTIYTNLVPSGDISGSVDTLALNTAMANCPTGRVVKLAAGTFYLNSYVKVKSGITVRGAGKGVTLIHGTNSGQGHVLGFGLANQDYENLTAKAISSGFTKDSTNIVTTVSHGLVAGNIILIDQEQDAAGDPPVVSKATYLGRASGSRCIGQVNKVVSTPTATTATLETPIYWNFNAVRNPELVVLTSVASEAGVEDLTIDNTDSACKDGAGTFYFAENCWYYRVEFLKSNKDMIFVYGAYQCTIRSCDIHESIAVGSNTGYGIWALSGSANLFEDNNFYHMGLGITQNGTFSGNVLAYNYFFGMGSDNTYLPEPVSVHGGHPMMNLYEGNMIESCFIADYYWGSSSHYTLLRNRIYNHPSPSYVNANSRIYMEDNQEYFNFVGNVLGVIGYETAYILSPVTGTGSIDTKAIMSFGCDGSSDTNSLRTALIHGNWDSVNRSIVWDPVITNRTIPASLYLTNAPSWFGDRPWPPVDPYNPATAVPTNLPAGYRYFYGNTTNQASVLPVVVLNAPFNGTNYLSPATISLAAGVTSNGCAIIKVQFFSGATLLGESSAVPYAYTWKLVDVGTYNLKARAIYNVSNAVDSALATVIVTLTNPAPVVTLTSPLIGAGYTAPAVISLAAGVAANGHTINAVRFYNGITLLGESSVEPYEMPWSGVATGSYTVTARAVYDAGNTADSASVVVTVTNAVAAAQSTGSIGVGQYQTDKFIAQKFTSQVTLTTATVACRLSRNGSPAFNVSCVLYSHNPANSSPLAPMGTESAPIAASTMPDSATDIVFSNVVASITNGGTYWVVLKTSAASNPNFVNWFYISSSYDANHSIMNSADGSVWNVTAASLKGIFSFGAAAPTVAPSVTLSAPSSGASHQAPANINLAASVTANGHTINKVQFFNGAELIGESISAPYGTLWSGVAAGNYTVTVWAVYDTDSTVGALPVAMTVTNAGTGAAVQSTGSIGVGQYISDKFVAQKFTARATYSTSVVTCRLSRNGAPAFNVSCVFYSHNPTNSTPLTPIGRESTPIVASTMPDTATDIMFSNIVASLTNGVTYWVVLKTSATSNPNYVNWYYSSSTYDSNHSIMNSADGGMWYETAASLQGIYSLLVRPEPPRSLRLLGPP